MVEVGGAEGGEGHDEGGDGHGDGDAVVVGDGADQDRAGEGSEVTDDGDVRDGSGGIPVMVAVAE